MNVCDSHLPSLRMLRGIKTLRHAAAAGALGLLLWPGFDAAWVSFSPNSYLTPPTGDWSLKWYRTLAEDRRWSAALGRSFVLAASTATAGVLCAGPAAWAVQRSRFFGRRLFKAGLLLPAVVPPAVLGMGLLPFLYRFDLVGSPVALLGAHTVVALPLLYWIFGMGLVQHSEKLEASARGLGASPVLVLRFVTLPLLRPAIVAAWVCGFLISWNESLVTIFLTTPSTETLPTLTWRQLKFSASPLVAAASTVGLVGNLLGIGIVVRIAARFRRLHVGA